MEYPQFVIEYEKLLTELMKYSPDQAGFNIYCSKLADLTDKYPEFEEMYDND